MSSKVPLVVTQSSSEQQTLPEVPPRPHSLHFLTPDGLEAADGNGEYDDNAGAGFNKERRHSVLMRNLTKVEDMDRTFSGW